MKKSILTDFLLENSLQWILYQDLEDKLIKEFSHLDKNKLKGVLHDMFKNQFIVSELTPNLLTDDPFTSFLSCLKKNAPQLENTFTALRECLNQYNAMMPGCGLQPLEKVHEILCEMYPNKKDPNQVSNFIQADASFSSKSTLTHKVAEEAADIATLIWKVSTSNARKKKLHDYHLQFLEKYGTEQLVPFLDLINENSGLGIPSCYLSTTDQKEKSFPFEQLLSKKYQEAIYHREREVVLSEDEIKEYLKKHPHSDAIPASLELFCEISAIDQAAVDAGNFHLILGLAQISQQVGNTFGRFLHVLPKETKAALLKAYAHEQRLDPEKIFVHFSWLPASTSAGNVAIGKPLRNFTLVFPANDSNEKNTISTEDLYVGASQNSLYLFSKQLNKELILITGNAVNQNLAPLPFQFLLDISKRNINPLQGIRWDQLEHFSYLPRLRCNKTYLSLARWNLCTEDISLKKTDISKQALKTWLKKWNVCRFVTMAHYDQYLLLDTEQESHLLQILSHLVKNDKVCLIEKISLEKSAWVQGSQGTYFTEFIIPLLKNASLMHTPSIYPQIENSCMEKRTYRLGSDWVYIKLFCCKNIQEELLKKIIPAFMQEIVEKKMCEKWFYIRYEENFVGPHIRLRAKASTCQILQTILPIIYSWSEKLIKDKFIKDISFHSYERELERYGGTTLIESAETLFHADSMMCISLLQNYPKNPSLPIHGIAALSIMDFLSSLNLSQEDQITFLTQCFSSKKALEGYRLHKKQLLDLAISLKTNKEPCLLKQSFLLRRSACSQYIQNAKHLNFLSSNGRKILRSFIHMHCNRLIGIDPFLEEKSIIFAAEIIKGLCELEKKKNLCLC
ncbi:MAG: lantibiotic dehydratase [Candidatus Rhabdochlamydia sp.]